MKVRGVVNKDGKTAKIRIDKILYDFYLANYCYYCCDSYKDSHLLIDCTNKIMIL
ncbi:hypothetical protein pb186bvf_015064 [Paramecium bursaria]